MNQRLRYASAAAIVGTTAAFASAAGCSSGSTSPGLDAGNGDGQSPGNTDSGAANPDGRPPSDGGALEAADYAYVLIDDMETTTHGPIELGGISPPLTPGYWFNFGANKAGDTASPPILTFTFTALPSPTTTYKGAMSAHAAHQFCSLTGQYDVCGLGFEFAQMTDPDAGVGSDAASVSDGSAAQDAFTGDAALTHDAASASDATSAHDAAPLTEAGPAAQDADADAGDAGPPIPKITVPFDIGQYTGIVFWAKTTADAGMLDLKVQFPDTDTDPRGGVCNAAAAGAAGPNDTSQCYNSYAVHETLTGDWQRYTLLFAELSIDPTFGYQNPGVWDGKKVYGINWQAQRNSLPDGGTETEDFWVDDVYFIK
jgi:hypothetical protein